MPQDISQKICRLRSHKKMFDTSSICYWSSKPLSILVKLDDNDEEKVKKVMNIIQDNFDLSPRGIREMLKLNKPIYQTTSSYGHFGRKPTDKGEFSWEKTDKADLFK